MLCHEVPYKITSHLFPLNKLKICFQSESHKNIAKSKQSRKFFVSPVKFTKVHVQGFVNEPTICTFLYSIRTQTGNQSNLGLGFRTV